jgi:hypothetical protein
MNDMKKIEKIIDYSYRKSVFQLKHGHPAHFGEYASYKEDLGLDHLTEIELRREFHKLIFYSHLRNYEIFHQILMSESAILFENIEKKYLKT